MPWAARLERAQYSGSSYDGSVHSPPGVRRRPQPNLARGRRPPDGPRIPGWTRVRPGAYTFANLWREFDIAQRHVLTGRAVARRLGGRVALSHTTAALDHGLTVWGADLGQVHVTRLDGGAGRVEAGVVHHQGPTLDDDLVERDGYAVTQPARAAWETAGLLSTEAGLVTRRFPAAPRARERCRARGDLSADVELARVAPCPAGGADGRRSSVLGRREPGPLPLLRACPAAARAAVGSDQTHLVRPQQSRRHRGPAASAPGDRCLPRPVAG